MKPQKQTTPDQQTVTIRAPRELIERLEQSAHEGDRSLNAEIVRRLRLAVEQEQGK